VSVTIVNGDSVQAGVSSNGLTVEVAVSQSNGSVVVVGGGSNGGPVQISGPSPGSPPVSVSSGAQSTNAVQVQLSPGIGPSIVVNGTSTSIVGTAGINPFIAGDNITITTTGGGITVIGRDPPVLSVNGRTGSVVLGVVDITAASASHTHAAAELSGFAEAVQAISPVASVQGRTGAVFLSAIDVTAAPAFHTHSTSQVSGLVTLIQNNSKVLSVQGRTGNISITAADVTAAEFSHTHSTSQISDFGSHTHSASQITDLASFANVVSVQGRTGEVVLSVSDITAATQEHSHPYVQSLSGVTGSLSIVGSGGVGVSASGTTITISGSEVGLQWYSPPPPSPDWAIGAVGDLARDDENLYVCVKSDPPGKWRRASLSTWTPIDPLFDQVVLLLHFSGLGNLTDSSPLNRTVTGPGWFEWGGVFESSGYNSIGFYGDSASTPPLVVPPVMDPEDQETELASWSLGHTYAIEFWVRLAASGTRTKIIGTGMWGIHATYQSVPDNFLLEFLAKDEDGNIYDSQEWGTISRNQWTFVCFTGTHVFVGTTMGQPATQRAQTGFWLDSLGDLTIGGDENGKIEGKMDEVRITRDNRYTPVNYWDPNSVVVIVPAAKFPDA